MQGRRPEVNSNESFTKKGDLSDSSVDSVNALYCRKRFFQISCKEIAFEIAVCMVFLKELDKGIGPN